MVSVRSSFWLLGACLLVGSGCKNDSKELSLCEQVSIKNELCDVNMLQGLASRPAKCSDASEEERCELECRLGAACTDLPANDDFDTEDCIGECRGGANFDCGGGQTISVDFVCDGFPDCPNEADEANCGASGSTFLCAGDGGTIAANRRCDGVADCPDSSDERGCF